MKRQRECNCNATVWCYIDGYLDPAPTVRLCVLGSKCLRAYRRKPAIVTGKGQYCSDVCRGTAQALRQRITPPEVACNPT